MPFTLPPRASLEQIQKLAKESLRERPELETLAHAQFTLAREYGFETWAALKRHVLALQPSLEQYEQLARDLDAAYTAGDRQAIREINWNYGTAFVCDDPESMRRQNGLASAQHMVAHAYGFDSWQDFAASVNRPARDPRSAPVFLSANPPFYQIDWQEGRLSARGPQSARDWQTIFAVMAEHRISKLTAGGMIDAAMPELAKLSSVTHLQLECRELTDEGAQHLAKMPQLEELQLGGPASPLTDRGLAALAHLAHLRKFACCWTQGISDNGLAHLAHCQRLERVNVMGTHTGDGTLRALTDKPHLTHLSTGRGVTDAGLAWLHRFPVYRTWRGDDAAFALMSFQAEPNHLMLDGPFTDAGLASLPGLDGLIGLSFFWHCPSFTSAGLAPLRQLARLEFLGCQGERCDDEAMRQIAQLPRLRMLMGQGAVAGNAGFRALSASRSLEYLWGRECPNLGSEGFAALSALPALKGLGVSCAQVDDAALALLPHFPALTSLMPMNVSDDGFRHVGACPSLAHLWCMYCRETGDAATGHLANLALRTYYAGKTLITDRSLAILARMTSLEKLEFWQCAGLTDAGVAHLAALPALREIAIDGMPHVSHAAVKLFPPAVRVRYAG